MKSTLANTDRVTVFTVNHEDGRSATAAIASSLSASTSPLASQAMRFVAAIGTLNEHIAMADNRFQPSARDEALRGVAAGIAADTQAFVKAGQAEARAISAAGAMARGYEAGNAPLRAQVRDKFTAMDVAGQAAFAQRASLEETSAIMEAGRSYFPGTPAPVWQLVEDRHIVQRHIAQTGMQADHQRQPDLNDPFAVGPDTEAVAEAARKSLNAFKDRSRVLDDAKAAFASVVDAVALAANLSREETYKLLTTGKIAE